MKIFNLKTHSINKIKEKNDKLIIVRKAFNADILNLPIKQMVNDLKIILQDIDDIPTDDKIIFYDLKLYGSCNKNDVEDFYDYVENVLTDIYCSQLEGEQKQEEKDRLGLFGLPKINFKTMNYLRWIKCNTKIQGIGLEVSKINSSWSKRLIK